MQRIILAVMLAVSASAGEVRELSLKEVIALAATDSPEVAMARLEEGKAAEAVSVARDPFRPKLAAGSGLAYSNGMPMSVGGATPSIMQAQATQYLFNRPQSYLVSEARENARGAAIATAVKREEAVLRAALAYLDAERARRQAEAARKRVERLERIADLIRVRVEEGRELPLEEHRARLSLARARQALEELEAQRDYAETTLAVVLGLDASQRVQARSEERSVAALPTSEDDAVNAAISSSPQLRRLESALKAAGYEIQAHKASRLPQVDLIAQYALLGRFNNYEDFFRKFQRHNTQIGISFQIPLFTGPAARARQFQAESEAARLRIELQTARNNLALEVRRLWRQAKLAETAREVARLDLEVAREQVSLLLAQMEEGRVGLKQVEEARLAEDEKWLAFIESHYALERAQLNLLHHTSGLLAALVD